MFWRWGTWRAGARAAPLRGRAKARLHALEPLERRVLLNGNSSIPVVDAGPDMVIGRGGTFAGIGSFADGDSSSWTGQVDWGEGAGFVPLPLNPDNTFSLSHAYAADGVYTVTVRIIDGETNVGSDSLVVTVRGPTLIGTAGNDLLYVRGDATKVQFFENTDPTGPPTFTILRAHMTTVSVQGNGGSDSLTVLDGSIAFAGDIGSGSLLALTTRNFANVTFGATQRLGGLTVSDFSRVTMTTNGSRILRTGGLSIGVNAAVDLYDNDMIVDYTSASPFAQIEAWIREAYKSGTWTGSGIRATLADRRTRGLGYAEWTQVLGPQGGYFGSELVTTPAVLIKYAAYGDARLDGNVNFGDLLRLSQNYGTTGKSWPTGDFDYDGNVNFNDLLRLSQQYGTTGLSPTPPAQPEEPTEAVEPAQAPQAATCQPTPTTAPADSSPLGTWEPLQSPKIDRLIDLLEP